MSSTPNIDLSQHDIFKGMNSNELNMFKQILHLLNFGEGEYMTVEEEYADSLFLILEGAVKVIKHHERKNPFVINTLKKGDTIGEMALFDNLARSSSTKAQTPITVIKFSFDDLSQLKKKNPLLYYHFTSNIGKIITNRLRYTNEVTVKSLNNAFQEATLRSRAANFLITLIIFLCLYAFVLAIFNSFFSHLYKNDVHAAYYIPLIMFTLIILPTTLIVLRHEHIYLKSLGVTKKNWGKASLEGFFYTLPILPLIVLLKWLLINYIPTFQSIPLFDGLYFTQAFSKTFILFLSTYILFVPVQEFIARGLFQGLLQQFLIGNFITLRAIFISNLIFSTVHLHLSWKYALASFIPGLFWGFLYAKQKTLVGAILSHIMIGCFAIYFVGIKHIVLQ